MLLLCAIWIADRAAGPDAFYDAGLYHLAAMKWASQYAIVPGLANLSMRLGFTSSVHLLAAMMNQGVWAGDGNHLLNGFFLVSLAAMVLRGAFGVVRGGARHRPDHWLMAFAALAVVEWAMDLQASSYSADIASMALAVVSAAAFLQSRTPGEDPSRQLFQVLACCTLCGAAISAKISSVSFATPLAVAALFPIVISRQPATTRLLRGAVAIALSVFIAIGWIVSQIILTGYPLYPSPMLATSVDWRVNKRDVVKVEHAFVNYCRAGTLADTTKDYSWVRRWIDIRVLHSWNVWKGLIPFSLGTVLLVATLLWQRWGVRSEAEWGPLHWVMLSAGIGIVTWFKTAPDPRYASHLFFIWFAAGASLFASTVLRPDGRAWRRLIPVLLSGAIALGPVIHQSWPVTSLEEVCEICWVSPDSNGGFHTGPVQPNLRQEIIFGGVVLYIAPKGSNQVWDAPLPNAPYLNPGVRLRKPPNLQGGFRIPPPRPGSPDNMHSPF